MKRIVLNGLPKLRVFAVVKPVRRTLPKTSFVPVEVAARRHCQCEDAGSKIAAG